MGVLNSFANDFECFSAFSVAVFDFIVAPGIAAKNPQAVTHWSVLTGFSLVLFVQCCFSDPWSRLRTMHAQHHLLGNDPAKTFDVVQPVESQMARGDRHALVKRPSHEARAGTEQIQQLSEAGLARSEEAF